MIGKTWRLFHLYRARHRAVHLRPRPLEGPEGQLGWLDRAWHQDGRVTVEGWSSARSVALRLGPRVIALGHRPERADVPAGFAARGFRGSVKAGEVPLGLRLGFAGGYTDIPLGSPRLRQRVTAELRVLRGFLRDGARALPHALAWLRTRAPADRARVRAALRVDAAASVRLVDPAVLGPAGPDAATPVTVVVPVYGARELTAEALRRLAAHTDVPWRAIVIDDASLDTRVWPMLRAWAADQGGRVTLLRNEENLGFVRTVNRALARAGTNAPVVLLNTDAMLPPGWAGRLLAPLADPSVASVTPISNDAEICTVPEPGHPVTLAPGEAEAIDRAAAALGGPCAEMPTGVGFCMALSPRWLARAPRLDEAFGKGYGEEVDWCQKTRALGARHVVQHRLFVEHRSSASFGHECRAKRIAEAGRIVAARYPRFDAEVQGFIAADPLATARMALALARLDAGGDEVPVILAHSMGGGAEMVLRRRLKSAGPTVVLRVGGPVRWRIELHEGGQVRAISTDDFDAVRRLTAPLRARVIYCCGVGDPDPLSLPGCLLALAGDGPVEVEVHDYFALSPSVFLLGADGRYRGVPAVGDDDPADRTKRPDGTEVSLPDWRREWGRLIARAEAVRVFSYDSARLMAAAYPCAEAKLLVEPHAPLTVPPRIPAATSGRRVVGVLGNIGVPKGAELLCDLAREAGRFGTVEFVLFGQLDPAFTPPSRLRVLGGYALDEIVPLALRHRVGAWLIPSICPETFSFATREALATGLPVVGLALGAQGEALTAHANGIAVPLQDRRALVSSVLATLEGVFDGGLDTRPAPLLTTVGRVA